MNDLQRKTFNDICKLNRFAYYSCTLMKKQNDFLLMRYYSHNQSMSYLISPEGRLIYYKILYFPNFGLIFPKTQFDILHKNFPFQSSESIFFD